MEPAAVPPGLESRSLDEAPHGSAGYYPFEFKANSDAVVEAQHNTGFA